MSSGPTDAPMDRGAEARRLARRHRDGALATQSLQLPGYPYVSALPFCTDQAGRIVVLASHLADHTRNALRDPRAAFLIAGSGPLMQEQARLSQIGELLPTEDEGASTRYLRFFPEGADYLRIGGFRFFRLEPKSLRYIAGFGSIHTLSPDHYLASYPALAQAEADILSHMNCDHAQYLRDRCRQVHGVDARSCEMVGIDCDGFDVRAEGAVLRFDFPREITHAGDARRAMMELAGTNRA
jgi:putative heme iron utilization protein